VKNKNLVVAASFALLLAVSVSPARADGVDTPWGCSSTFLECLVQGVENLLAL
jgi:hypothetical protein